MGALPYCVWQDGLPVVKFGLCREHLAAIINDGWAPEVDPDEDEYRGKPVPRAPVQRTKREPVTQHGTVLEYGRGCRCLSCKAASREHSKALYYAKKAEAEQ